MSSDDSRAIREYYSGLPDDYEPRIHVGEVSAVRTVSDGMLRVSIAGADMADYPTADVGDEYVRLYFPGAGPDPVWPFVAARGWDYPDGAEPMEMRTYTIRAHRAGEVDIDFVVHEGGVAAAWAAQAVPGLAVGITPPQPMYNRPEWARRQILIADEPALPAALRIVELTSHEVETIVIAEVRSEAHQLEADFGDASYTWLRGSGNGHAPSSLVQALRRTDIDDSTFVWVAAEARLTREARKYLRHERTMAADSYRVVGYWTDNGEEWTARYEALGADVHAHLQALYESDRDTEEIVDEIFRVYEAAGL